MSKALKHLSKGVLGEWRIWVILEVSIQTWLMKCNKNKFADMIFYLNCTPIVNIFLARFQTITLRTWGWYDVSSTLYQRCDVEATSNEGGFNPRCLKGIYLNANTGLLKKPGIFCKRGSLGIHLKIQKQLLKVAPWMKLFLHFVNINITYNLAISSQCSHFIHPGNTEKPKVFWRLQGV